MAFFRMEVEADLVYIWIQNSLSHTVPRSHHSTRPMRLGSRGPSEFSAVRLTFPARARVSLPALTGLGREQV